MNISTTFLTLALLITSFIGSADVQAMDISSYKNQALTSIRLELWYQGVDIVDKESTHAPENAQEAVELPEELAVALQMQLAH